MVSYAASMLEGESKDVQLKLTITPPVSRLSKLIRSTTPPPCSAPLRPLRGQARSPDAQHGSCPARRPAVGRSGRSPCCSFNNPEP